MMIFVLWIVTFLHIFTASVNGQDLGIYGKFSSYLQTLDARERSQIASTCFTGIGFSTCKPILPDDDIVLYKQLPYLLELSSLSGALFCLQCCGKTEDHTDIWDLRCPLDFSAPPLSVVYGYELRLAANQYPGDTSIVTCPLKRNGCIYDDEGGTVECNLGLGDPNEYFVGYTLVLEVQEFQYEFQYWNGVSKCSMEAIVSDTPLSEGDEFQEIITINYTPKYPQGLIDYYLWVIVTLGVLGIIYASLYFCRRQHCVYCQQKMVFSINLCYKCWLVGAETPDPLMLKALEEKGIILQGTIPERFPGSTMLINWVRAQSRLVCICFSKTCAGISKLCCGRKDAETYPEEKDDGGESGELALDGESKEAGSTSTSTRTGSPSGRSTKSTKSLGGIGTESERMAEESYKNRLESEKRKERRNKKKGKKEHINPNLLAYKPEIIYLGIGHPNPPFKTQEQKDEEDRIAAQKAEEKAKKNQSAECFRSWDEKEDEDQFDAHAALVSDFYNDGDNDVAVDEMTERSSSSRRYSKRSDDDIGFGSKSSGSFNSKSAKASKDAKSVRFESSKKSSRKGSSGSNKV